MLFETFFKERNSEEVVNKLESYHRREYSPVLWVILIGFMVFILWASFYRINQTARAMGEVIASSRVQLIQAVDGGVLEKLYVKEGDIVKKGQTLARLENERFLSSVKEIEARLNALRIKATRLRAEIKESPKLVFAEDLLSYDELIAVERALFKQRRKGFKEEVETLKKAVKLAKEELALLKGLSQKGDVNRSEVIRVEKELNDAEAKLIVRKNKYLEDTKAELAKAEDGISQNEHILTQRKHELGDTVFTSLMPGIVKNIRVTTVGGVLRSGEELMQIIPLNDELIIEAKVKPSDIGLVKPGLDVNIRFDPYDYTIFGSVKGKVSYVSADTLKKESRYGEEIYYNVHIKTSANPVKSTTGQVLNILPGMTAELDIKTGDRTVMAYLLKPLHKTLTVSLTER